MKHLSQILTALVTAFVSILLTICVQWWFVKGITPAQASVVGYLLGLGCAGLVGFAIHCFSLERLKEDNQEKQRQWERDRAEPTLTQKSAMMADEEARLEAAMDANDLKPSYGNPVRKADGVRVCRSCLLKKNMVIPLEERQGLGGKKYYVCPRCGK